MLFPRKAGSYDSDEAHIVAAVLPLCFTAAAAAVTMSAMRQQDIDDISALIASALQVLDKMHAIHNLIPSKGNDHSKSYSRNWSRRASVPEAAYSGAM